MHKQVRVLIVGDEQVGKTSLISGLLTEQFSQDVPHVLPEITIPPELTPENITTIIVDTSASEDDKLPLEEEIRKAHVICIVYSFERPVTFDRVRSFWIPYLRTVNFNSVPIILTNNKIDLRTGKTTNERIEEQILPFLSEYREIENYVETSAKSLLNIAELFYFAQKAVLHPTIPLFDKEQQILKIGCIQALTRIFTLSDRDNDGFLDDKELYDFQFKCFGVPLPQQEIEGIKQIISKDDSSMFTESGMTLEGFLHLHRVFLQKGRSETVWTILRRYGYDDELELRRDLLYPKIEIDSENVVVELSSFAFEFLTNLFMKYDSDHDGVLKLFELNKLFSITPDGNPFKNGENNVNLNLFLSEWSTLTLLDHEKSIEYLVRLGWEEPAEQAIVLIDRQNREKRSIFYCLLVGAVASGKSSLLRLFLNRSFEKIYTPTSMAVAYMAVNDVVDYESGRERNLIINEITPHSEGDSQILSDSNHVSRCDVICYTYDIADPNSFSYIATVRDKFPQVANIPSIIIGTKGDLCQVRQNFPLQPEEYCKKNCLSEPIKISVKEGANNRSIFKIIFRMAAYSDRERKRKNRDHLVQLSWPWWFGFGTSVLGIGIAIMWYWNRAHRNN